MKNVIGTGRSLGLLALLGAFAIVPLHRAAAGLTYTDPGTTQSFSTAVTGMKLLNYYTFGSENSRTIRSLSQLAALFDPYGIAGTIVINNEWERYKPFNAQNFVFTSNTLDLTATIPAGGGLFAGGINSGQIWTHATYQPGVTGYTVYAIDVNMKIPGTPGMWPAAWLYSKGWGTRDSSEIDNPEFMDMQNQSSWDWTGYDHGPGLGAEIFSRKTNQWVWHPGFDFSQAYHDFELIWTPDAVYKYVDGMLIYAQAFKWTSAETAQFGVNLAVGSSIAGATGLQPTSLNQFPAALSIHHIYIWGK